MNTPADNLHNNHGAPARCFMICKTWRVLLTQFQQQPLSDAIGEE